MPAVSIHSATIEWSLSGLSFDPLAELLAGLSPASPEDVAASSTKVRLELRPSPPEAAADPRDEGWVPAFFHGIVEAHRSESGFLVWDRASRVFIPRDGGVIDARIATPEQEVVRGSLKSVLQVSFALALRLQAGLFHLHAAALVLASGVPVFVVGESGAGKTSTTLALLEGPPGGRGADYLGDDTLYLTRAAPPGAEPGGDALHVVAFPREFHIGDSTLASVPRLGPLLGPLPHYGTKRPLDARLAYPGRFRPYLSLARDEKRALALFPTVAAGAPATEVVPLARAEAFGRFLGSSGAIVVEGIPGRDENLALLSALLGAVRCYEVRLGTDALADPAKAIAERVAQLEGRA